MIPGGEIHENRTEKRGSGEDYSDDFSDFTDFSDDSKAATQHKIYAGFAHFSPSGSS